MTSEQIRQRSDIINMQVIARDTGKRLGVVKELLVDVDGRSVVALGLRDSMLSLGGMPKFMLLRSIRQIGDVILVDDENAIEDMDVDPYSSLINSEVITENGELLGKVRGFKFNAETGELVSAIVASLGFPLIPDVAISTYELPIEELVSSGPDRLIVFEGAQDRLVQLTVGVMERLGIGEPPWERDQEETFLAPSISVEKQLPTGRVAPEPEPRRVAAPAVQEGWDEDEWEEPQAEPVSEPEPVAYYDEEEDNWSEVSRRDQYERYDDDYAPEKYPDREYEEEYEYEDVENDAWAPGSDQPYQPPRVNIPEKTKAREYEEEPGGY
ncbi:MAG TPA: PRC-barrel domain-containing protein [Oscillatoriaceae cyanobacterium M33_DOE_052]|nr:PRC-barrel domain-containing protein [Oscillatoriaceae cyanobacterium M33_DOE_052]